MFNPLAVDSPPPDIPLPAVFQSVNSWSYSSSPFVSPVLNTKAGLDDIMAKDPDVIVVQTPDKVQVFDTPGQMEYVWLPPPKITKTDPTGMNAMMEFLGFKNAGEPPPQPGPPMAEPAPPQPGQAIAGQAPLQPGQAMKTALQNPNVAVPQQLSLKIQR